MILEANWVPLERLKRAHNVVRLNASFTILLLERKLGISVWRVEKNVLAFLRFSVAYGLNRASSQRHR